MMLLQEYIFYGCDNLAYIDISNFNMEKCEFYDNMFSSTNKIKFINLFNLTNDKTISQVFSKTKNMISPKNVKKVSINTFKISLQRIHVPFNTNCLKQRVKKV